MKDPREYPSTARICQWRVCATWPCLRSEWKASDELWPFYQSLFQDRPQSSYGYSSYSGTLCTGWVYIPELLHDRHLRLPCYPGRRKRPRVLFEKSEGLGHVEDPHSSPSKDMWHCEGGMISTLHADIAPSHRKVSFFQWLWGLPPCFPTSHWEGENGEIYRCWCCWLCPPSNSPCHSQEDGWVVSSSHSTLLHTQRTQKHMCRGWKRSPRECRSHSFQKEPTSLTTP